MVVYMFSRFFHFRWVYSLTNNTAIPGFRKLLSTMTWTMMTVTMTMAIELWKICTMRKMHLCRIRWNFRQHSERDSGNEQKSFSEKCRLWISVRGSVQSTFNPPKNIYQCSSFHWPPVAIISNSVYILPFDDIFVLAKCDTMCNNLKDVWNMFRNIDEIWRWCVSCMWMLESKWKLHNDIRKDINH